MNDIYIDYHSFDSLLGLSAPWVNQAVHTAISPWNNNANSGYFRMAGTQNDVVDWVVAKAGESEPCTNEYANDLLLFVSDNCQSGIYGAAAPVQLCGEWTTLVALCENPPRDWSTFGFPSSTEVDLAGVLTHEFGHVLDLDHPSATQSCPHAPTPAVMEAACSQQFTGLRMRQLYPYDVECSNERGFRDVSVEGAIQSGSSSVFSSYSFAESFAIKGAPGWVSGQDFRMMTRKATGSSDDRTRFVLREGHASGSSPSQGWNVGYSGVLPLTSWWRESPWDGDIRLFLNHTSTVSWTASTSVRQYAYDASDINAGQTFNAWLRRCTAASPASCPRLMVRSAERLSFAWDDYAENTVAVWQHQNRLGHSGDFEIVIGKGIVEEDVLGFTAPTERFTAAGPAVACASHAVNASDGDFDCILAWTDLNDPLGRIQLAFFYENISSPPGPSGANLVWSSQTVTEPVNSNSRTAFPLSVWRNDGKWWLAHSMYDNRVRILRSDDGVNWTWHQTFGDWSITAAAVSVADSSTTTRRIVLSRPN